MKTLFAITFLVLFSGLPGASRTQPARDAMPGGEWRAVCVDGHGALHAGWLSYDSANGIGKEHERRTKGHRWDMVQR